MANKFKVWIDSSNSNVLSEQEYASDDQRINGFVTRRVASSKRVNSALRSSTLVTAALMGLVDNSNLDLTSSLSDVQAALATYFTTVGSVTEDDTVAGNVVKFSIGNSIYNKTVNNVANVTTSLNGVSLTGANGIFEDDGKKAKNATNVTNQINGKNISAIFETNGTTVKEATQADNANKVQNIDFSEDSIARFGSYTIPKRKLLWSGSQDLSNNNSIELNFPVDASKLSLGYRELEIIVRDNINSIYKYKLTFQYTTSSAGSNIYSLYFNGYYYGPQGDFDRVACSFSTNTTSSSSMFNIISLAYIAYSFIRIDTKEIICNSTTTSKPLTVYKIYELIYDDLN